MGSTTGSMSASPDEAARSQARSERSAPFASRRGSYVTRRKMTFSQSFGMTSGGRARSRKSGTKATRFGPSHGVAKVIGRSSSYRSKKLVGFRHRPLQHRSTDGLAE